MAKKAAQGKRKSAAKAPNRGAKSTKSSASKSKTKPTKSSAPAASSLARKRGRITPPPPHNVAKLFPSLAAHARETVRLHPQRENVEDMTASKLGGEILWPRDETWPVCPDASHKKNAHPTLVPIVQLRKDDVPELGFPPDCDLFQLLWCPSNEHTTYAPLPHVVWRHSFDVGAAIANQVPVHADKSYVPQSCRITPERVIEYPPLDYAAKEMFAPLKRFANNGVYQFDLSVCPGTKVGGYPGWVQDPRNVLCDAGHAMEFLLQLTDSEYTNVDRHPRWIPTADRWIVKAKRRTPEEREAIDAVYNPANFRLGHSVYYLFICRQCEGWPVKLERQR